MTNNSHHSPRHSLNKKKVSKELSPKVRSQARAPKANGDSAAKQQHVMDKIWTNEGSAAGAIQHLTSA
jgi:hypothetical protein